MKNFFSISSSKKITDSPYPKTLVLEEVNHEKVADDNILDKLLRPPSLHEKKINSQPRKFDPKFMKPDNETLAQENLSLKLQMKQDKQTIMNMKFKLAENERKIKALETAQQKYERYLATGSKYQNEQMPTDFSDKQNKEMAYEGKKDYFSSCMINPVGEQKKTEGIIMPVYTEILKKKIHQLNALYSNAESHIRQLKKLPNVSIFEEGSIEKEHLMAETIRLKAIITSLVQRNNEESQEFQSQFLKLMKQENEKLKATNRLLDNDKNLLKSRQSIQKKANNDLKKEIQDLRHRMMTKDAEIEKLTSQNKNLLFKKMSQFRMEQQKKENEELAELRGKIEELSEEKVRLQEQLNLYCEDNQLLKEKEKKISEQLIERELNYEADRKGSADKIELIMQELAHLRSQYISLSNIQKKRKGKIDAKIVIEKRQVNRPVKIEDIELGLLKIYSLVRSDDSNCTLQLQSLFDDSEQFKCCELVQLLTEENINLPKHEAIKLARFIVEDNNQERIVYDEQATVKKNLMINILKSSMNRLLDCQQLKNEEQWTCLLSRSKKLMNELQQLKGQAIKKDRLIDILSRNILGRIEYEYIMMILLVSFDSSLSEQDIMLNVDMVLAFFKRIMEPK